MKSEYFSLNKKDFLKGLYVTILTAIVTGVYQFVNISAFPQTWADWKTILISSLGAGLAYIIKNGLTNSDDDFLKKEIDYKNPVQ